MGKKKKKQDDTHTVGVKVPVDDWAWLCDYATARSLNPSLLLRRAISDMRQGKYMPSFDVLA